ncbi:hypothetical protein K435DRAFT_590354, partial [Dendrothele bispora CBS 962.96]
QGSTIYSCCVLITRTLTCDVCTWSLFVTMFIKHILGVDSDHDGIFGQTAAHYGTVEQQGRLTLHLHMLLWIKGSYSPQEIRD